MHSARRFGIAPTTKLFAVALAAEQALRDAGGVAALAPRLHDDLRAQPHESQRQRGHEDDGEVEPERLLARVDHLFAGVEVAATHPGDQLPAGPPAKRRDPRTH